MDELDLDEGFFDSMLEESMSIDDSADSQILEDTTLFDFLGDEEEEEEVQDGLDLKDLQVIEEKRKEVRIAVAQYFRLWKRELDISRASAATVTMKYSVSDDTLESKFIGIYLSRLPKFDSIEKSIELFRMWYFGQDEAIKPVFGKDIYEAIQVFSDVRRSMFDRDNQGYKDSYSKYLAELKKQIVAEQKLIAKHKETQDKELEALAEYGEDNIVIAGILTNPDAELKMEKQIGLPLTFINDGELVTAVAPEELYGICEIPIQIATNTDNNLMFKCICGEYVNAKDAITYIEDKGGCYQRVRPVKCKCGKHLYLPQLILFRFGHCLFMEKSGIKNSVITKSVHKLGIDSIIGITVEEEERPSAPAARRILGLLSTNMVPNIKERTEEEYDSLKNSFVEYMKAKSIRSSVGATDDCVLSTYILSCNEIDVSLSTIVNYIYGKLRSQVFIDRAIYNRARATAINNNRFRQAFKKKAADPLYTNELTNPKLITKTYLNKQDVVQPELKENLKSVLSESVNALIDKLTVVEYVKDCKNFVDSSEIYHSGIGNLLETLLVEGGLLEYFIEVLFSSFVQSILNTGLKLGILHLPQRCQIVTNKINAIRAIRKVSEEITPFELYNVFERSGMESMYAASKQFSDISVKVYDNYKAIDTLELVNDSQILLTTLGYISNIEEAVMMFFGIEETQNPFEYALAKSLFLEVLLEAFPIEEWRDQTLYTEFEVYLALNRRKWE